MDNPALKQAQISHCYLISKIWEINFIDSQTLEVNVNASAGRIFC